MKDKKQVSAENSTENVKVTSKKVPFAVSEAYKSILPIWLRTLIRIIKN